MVREVLLKFMSPSIRLTWVTVWVSTNLTESGSQGGSQSGRFTLIGLRPRGSETKTQVAEKWPSQNQWQNWTICQREGGREEVTVGLIRLRPGSEPKVTSRVPSKWPHRDPQCNPIVSSMWSQNIYKMTSEYSKEDPREPSKWSRYNPTIIILCGARDISKITQ